MDTFLIYIDQSEDEFETFLKSIRTDKAPRYKQTTAKGSNFGVNSVVNEFRQTLRNI